MQKFKFFNPVKVVFGAGERSRIGSESKVLGTRALLVSYKNYEKRQALLDEVTGLLTAEGIQVVPFYGVCASPTIATVREAVEICRAERIDLIVAVGGGSVIDAAKVIAAGARYDGDSWDLVHSSHAGAGAVIPELALPLVTLSTLPGTGSEMNCWAVVTNEETMAKSYLSADCVYPKVSILDAELSLSLPPYQTACGIIDAISHVLEVYWNGADGAPLSQRIMEGVTQTLLQYAPVVFAEPNNVEARAHIQWATCVAWNGWTWPGTTVFTPMQMMAHAISARYGVAHGAALSILVPAFMKFSHEPYAPIYAQFGVTMLGVADIGSTLEKAQRAVVRFEKILTEFKLPMRLSDCEIGADAIDQLVDDCARVYFTADQKLPARIPLSKTDVRRVLEMAL